VAVAVGVVAPPVGRLLAAPDIAEHPTRLTVAATPAATRTTKLGIT
jgi:hypothetical protein